MRVLIGCNQVYTLLCKSRSQPSARDQRALCHGLQSPKRAHVGTSIFLKAVYVRAPTNAVKTQDLDSMLAASKRYFCKSIKVITRTACDCQRLLKFHGDIRSNEQNKMIVAVDI
jgi:hypothetical protein